MTFIERFSKKWRKKLPILKITVSQKDMTKHACICVMIIYRVIPIFYKSAYKMCVSLLKPSLYKSKKIVCSH